MRIKLSDYILEQSISDASASDIVLEQSIAEIEVSMAVCEAYIKQMDIQLYAEAEGPPQPQVSTQPVQQQPNDGAEPNQQPSVQTQSQNNQHADKLSQLKYKNKHMTVGDKILWYNTVFLGKVWAWFVRAFTNLTAYCAKQHVDEFLKRLQNMPEDQKASFSVRINTIILRTNNANDVMVNIKELKNAVNKLITELEPTLQLACSITGVDSNHFKEISEWILPRINDEIKLPSLNLPEPIYLSYVVSQQFIWVTKFISEGNKLLSDKLKKSIDEHYGVNDSNKNDLVEVKKRLGRLQGLPNIIGAIGMKLMNKIGRKRGYFDAGHPEVYEDLNHQQTVDLIQRLLSFTNNDEVKKEKAAMTKSNFIAKTSEAIAGENVDNVTRAIAKIMFNAYKQFYKVTLMVMSNGTNCIGHIVNVIEKTINNNNQNNQSEEKLTPAVNEQQPVVNQGVNNNGNV